MSHKSFPLSKVYSLLEPGPVILVTTEAKEKQNVMAMSWYTMLDFTPPLIGIVMSDRNYSFSALTKTKECVIAIPTVRLAGTMVKVGNCSGENTDKFKKFHLTALPASRVKAPLIAECYANIECKVRDETFAEKYNFFVLEAVKAWVDPRVKDPKTVHHRGRNVFVTDGKILKIASKKK